LSVQQELIQHGDSISARTCSAIDRLLEQDCTAIVTSNSLMSVQASYRLSSLGISIGRDIDLLAYKDYEFYNTFLSHCDLIVQPVIEFGNFIADTILERIESPDEPLKERVLTSYFQPKSI
jgi:LacI family transcriptional regulator